MSLRLSDYLKDLRLQAHRFEKIDINNRTETSVWGKNQRRIICIFPSLIAFLFLSDGFSVNFVSYVSTALSILIGLFTSSIIFIFDKYEPLSTLNPNSKERLLNTQAYNYTKQFAYLTGYSIVLSILILILLSLSVLFENYFNIEITKYQFDFNLTYETIKLFINILLVIIQRILILYLIFSVLYYTLYSISSMIKYMAEKLS